VYVFRRTSGVWSQEAYIKASNTNRGDEFGAAVALSADGSTLAVGAPGEASAATGVDANQADNTVPGMGAVYVFQRAGAVWSQSAYVKASNADNPPLFGIPYLANFGESVTLSAEGDVLAVGAPDESSASTGVNGSEDWTFEGFRSGAAYVFRRTGDAWAQEAYIKSSNTDDGSPPSEGDSFGKSLILSSDGRALAVAAPGEDSRAVGIGGDQADESMVEAGAVYVFRRSGDAWAQEAYVKASNTDQLDRFGTSLGLSMDGNVLAVGAWDEDSDATGLGGDQTNNREPAAGAAYLFRRVAGVWGQEAYVKRSNTGRGGGFGVSLALAADGETLAVGAPFEQSLATGVGGDQTDRGYELASSAGAVYVFRRTGGPWRQVAYVKASNAEKDNLFGGDSVSGDYQASNVALSADGLTLAVGAPSEESTATGVNGDQTNNAADGSGAVYVY
jgi:hypothetical protein